MNAAELTWSFEQDRVFRWAVGDAAFFRMLADDGVILPRLDVEGHLVVRARAGTGKTTTIVEMVKRWVAANPGKRAIVCAFNVRIAAELKKRFIGFMGVEVLTLHALGFRCIRPYRDRLIVEDKKKVIAAGGMTRADALAQAACGTRAPDTIVRMVSKLHTLGRETTPHAEKPGDLMALAIEHDLTPDEAMERVGFGADFVEKAALAAMAAAAEIKSGDTIDFSDMIFLPCRHGWIAGQADLIVVDETQDMTQAQLEIATGSLNPAGRMCLVGDNLQAIYAFRGADSNSLDRLKDELSAGELGLAKTYRCCKAVVRLVAARWAPDFNADDANPEGEVLDSTYAEMMTTAGPGDFILSRVNAPLVPTAMKLLRAGKRARIAGKSIGDGLVSVLRRLKGRTVPDLLSKIEMWAKKETARHEKALETATNGRKAALKAKIEHVADTADMLVSLTDAATSVDHVRERAESLFVDDGLGDLGLIVLSSVHKSKGLEAKRVWVLADTLRDDDQEEVNIQYVAATRAIETLVWVRG